MYRLIFQNGSLHGRQVTVRGGEILLGRGPVCELRIPDSDMAMRHARIRETNGQAEIEAMDGAEVQINGLRQDRAVLASGDRIVLGSVALRFLTSESGDVASIVSRRRASPQRMTAALIVFVIGWQVGLLIQSRFLARTPPVPPPRPPQVEPASVPEVPAEPATNIEPFVLHPEPAE